MGGVAFTGKSEPAYDWSELESRSQDVSKPCASSNLPVEPSASLANDPPAIDASPRAAPEADRSDLLSLLAAIPSNQS